MDSELFPQQWPDMTSSPICCRVLQQLFHSLNVSFLLAYFSSTAKCLHHFLWLFFLIGLVSSLADFSCEAGGSPRSLSIKIFLYLLPGLFHLRIYCGQRCNHERIDGIIFVKQKSRKTESASFSVNADKGRGGVREELLANTVAAGQTRRRGKSIRRGAREFFTC